MIRERIATWGSSLSPGSWSGRVSGRIGQLTGAGSPAAILRIAAIVAATALR
jgi:hypothetical protein